ncbi:hypothetical protein BH10PSE10_BH10PSE10_04720 [soil metagenome]
MPISTRDIHEGCFYIQGWPRLVIQAFGDEITYLDPWVLGQCQRGTFAKWADRIMTADDEIKFANDIKSIRELRESLTGGETTSKIRLVVKNDPAQLMTSIAQADDDRRRHGAALALQRLVANLLRVIAGAGEPHRLPRDFHDTFASWADFSNAHQYSGEIPGVDELRIDRLFPDDDESPQTEEEWRRWAEPDPLHDYQQVRRLIIHRLRRNMLREVAETIAGNDMQIRRNERDIEQSLDQLETALDKYRKESKKPPKPNPINQKIAEDAIAKLRADKREKEIADREAQRDKMIANLAAHQWTALRAVRSGDPADFERNDAFTFEVLGGMKLLKRKPGSGKSKRDWELTDLGMLALSRASAVNEDNQG